MGSARSQSNQAFGESPSFRKAKMELKAWAKMVKLFWLTRNILGRCGIQKRENLLEE